MIPRFPVYLFDVDGTLVDSAPDICAAVQSVLHSRGRLDVPDAVLRTYIGKHLDDTWRDLGFPESDWAPMLADYRQIYAGRGVVNVPQSTYVSYVVSAGEDGFCTNGVVATCWYRIPAVTRRRGPTIISSCTKTPALVFAALGAFALSLVCRCVLS